ncbi:Hsp20/alpha crystallin family protein [Sulfuriroseicoccus oceanibius]|uniref:Hsp20/alpha crystallin family protein n=1 Tax=Sulfuriroseicoccus oceanibius TaxID=2707525 RepID=A0A6B3L4V0_9BACT|nr:Hsp20/alpha crystallin family protein [Sulfuriroseicoccus oceanibius]QQL43965.1 Hsp20/alpha crystallin family protein [Sulfuriroseicoccus oceanibius]
MKNKIETWDPFREMTGLSNRLSSIFGNESGELLSANDLSEWRPAVDVAEDDKCYTITADLPEVSRQDAKVSVKDGVLTISGERKRELQQADVKFHRIERSYGTYQRSFHIPESVDPDAIKAVFKDGVLTITMPKSVPTKHDEHEIEVE